MTDPSEPVEPSYVAEVVAVHPMLDAALLQVVPDVNGQPVAQVDSEVLPIGSSERLPSGTHVHQLGFPGAARTNELSIAEVTIQSYAPLLLCSNLEPGAVVPGCTDGEMLEDGQMNFSSAAGPPGAPFVHDGTVVAINVGFLRAKHSDPPEGHDPGTGPPGNADYSGCTR